MRYRQRRTEEIFQEIADNDGEVINFDDIFCGSDYLEACAAGKITNDDILLLFSADGCQLYEKKASDCWIYIWIIADLSPDCRYKKKYVLPGGFIPGPNKPKNLDSFIFPGLFHIAGLQREGLRV
ncbi:hypothetical protein NEOLEDRAFT_1031232, partial [Neolentinus lepideus HHB14362 ss-1]